jgi:hypothetical protein
MRESERERERERERESAVWRTLVERLKVDLILATETISLRTTFTT